MFKVEKAKILSILKKDNLNTNKLEEIINDYDNNYIKEINGQRKTK